MAIVVRLLREDEGRTYLEIVNSAIRGIASHAYPAHVVDAWVHPITDRSLAALSANADKEIRLIAEVDGVPVGIGALVLADSELRACYVSPACARRGCGSAIVKEIERIARENHLTHLELIASINAEPFYAAHGYQVCERREHVLRGGVRMAAVAMTKSLDS
jgi:putative acetyltransferase